MDISDDLCRPDFFDLVPMALDPKFGDPSSHSLMPVTLIDSVEYMQPDANNNLSGSTGHIKSFLDEMFLADPLHNGDGSQSIATLNSSTFEVLGTFQWSGDGTNTGPNSSNPSGDDDSPAGDPNSWFLSPGFNGDGEVTTLTNLIDPLFVTYEDDHGGSGPIKIEQDLGETRVVSSDLISSSVFLNEPTGDSPTDASQSSSESDLISWQKSSDVVGNGGGSIYCDDSLLRSALQSGNNTNGVNSKVVKLTAVVASSIPTNEMTELRKVLSFPPLTSPTSSTSDILNPNSVSSPDGQAQTQPFYELKVIDPLFSDDSNIPNVEELIMTRIDTPFGGYQQGKDQKKKLSEISERKINSTTLSTKWTYTTTNEQGKTPRRRNKKNGANNNNSNSMNMNKKTSPGMNENSGLGNGGPYSPTSKSNNSSSSNGGSPSSQLSSGPNSNGNPSNGNGIRKERSLHYCNICCKGFKDKYSVNVHVRTHTGEKPFACNLCGKNFRQKAHLAKHYQTHAAKANNQQNKPNSKR